MRKKGIKADPLPKTEPTIIKGDSFVSGYAVKEVISAGLAVLGINSPEQM